MNISEYNKNLVKVIDILNEMSDNIDNIEYKNKIKTIKEILFTISF